MLLSKKSFVHFALCFFEDEQGATAIEYGLLAGILVVGIVAVLQSMGKGVHELYNSVVTAFQSI
ncbi:MAG: Flp family type IVb pilin [Rhodospirillales bacterium]|nr:Flp family type IVb pilin [Rhodospirillales bacterium]